MSEGEDVYDVGRTEPGHMACPKCGVVFDEYAIEEIEDDGTVEVLYWDLDECPACGSELGDS